MDLSNFDLVVVGAGFYGATLAERAASVLGRKVCLLERRHATGKTLIYREYSCFAGQADEPYYPVNTARDQAMLSAYKEMARLESGVLFGGRLGSYKYLDMHQAIGAALKAFREQVVPFFGRALAPAA